ncbi:ABC transporter substrate-binding protein [Methylorubrum rhodesianum]|uniref:ABC transporter substrate-binding protein n=1 Tax=Methylorubrum rhodesianum TaxID=29427 RepID=A0ABU9ZG01_9HYPH|nr:MULTISPECIES: ABC transporter substrate-binding protein [Methylorubrum]MBB5765064.1 phospholipid transport system substrate-binding protein [Methylorubrum rhodesianum]MBI1691217.1 ABC transporter substrate-binding protein [Methylorubrum sp. DB1722]
MRLNRRTLLAAALATVAASGTPQIVRAAEDPAVEPIRRLYAKFEEALKNGAGDLKSRLAIVGDTLAATFDTPAMVRTAVGPKWKTFKPEQQEALTETFGRYFVTLYANRLSQAAGGKFDIKPQSEERGPNRVVSTRVSNKDGDESDVDYVVNASNRVQDVLLNGNVSEVASMRASFADPLKGGADGLLKFMRDRTDGMLAAKVSPRE